MTMSEALNHKMIIGIDGNEANSENRVGVNQYGYELLWALHRLQDEWKNSIKIIVYLKNQPRADMPPATSHFKYKVLEGRGLWIITKLMPELIWNREKLDVVFSLSHYIPPISRIPRVCTIHDLGYLEFSEQFKKFDFWQLKYWSAYSIFISKAIIAVSNSTKMDIVRHYKFASGKVSVIYHGYDKTRFNPSIDPKDVRRVLNKYSIVNDYVLYLSTLKPSKNVEGILTAWKAIKSDFPSISLVIAGKKGWLYQSIFDKAQKLGLKDVIFTDFVPEKDKAPLISGARLFVLPSFWEGFGLDALNAMACGVPAVVSKVGSLPEVAGEAGVMVDPYDIESIASGIKKVLSMPEMEYNTLVARGLKQAQKFSWEKTARQTLEVLEKTAIK